MTLETISRIETALNIDLIGSALSAAWSMDMTLPKVHRARAIWMMWNNLHLRVSKNALIIN